MRDTSVTHADGRYVTRGVRTRAENDDNGAVLIVVRDEVGAVVRRIAGENALELRATSQVSRTLIVEDSVEPDPGATTTTRGT
ncbi:MAG: hypothetical protein ACLP0J_15820 [Solirubrobacteraceae bacterium]